MAPDAVSVAESPRHKVSGVTAAIIVGLIKGHEKEAAHALFESVKNGKFGNY